MLLNVILSEAKNPLHFKSNGKGFLPAGRQASTAFRMTTEDHHE
jgi:hypothetical protein